MPRSKRTKTSTIIYQKLKEEIRSGALPSDTPLGEMELAERFGVSRTPVREALHILSSERLIRIVPNVGAYVGTFTWEDAREIFVIRQVLEAFAAGLTAQNISEKSLERIEALLGQMQAAINESDTEAYAAIDEEFHTILNDECGNKNLIQIIENLNDQSKLSDLRRNQYRISDRLRESFSAHQEIVAALNEHDSKKARNLLMKHGQNIFGDVTKIDLPGELF